VKYNKLFNGDNSLKQRTFVIRELTSREIKRKYARSYLGLVWSFLNPLLHSIVMTLIFSYMFRRSIENFPLYYLCGYLFWDLFNEGTTNGMTALVDNKNLLLKSKLHKSTFVLSRVYTSIVNMGLSGLAFICIMVVFKARITWTAIVFIPDFILMLLFTLGFGFTLSILYVFFADIKHLYAVIKTFWFYLNALFYPVDRLPEVLQRVIGYNPIYLSIYIAREGILYGRWPHYTAWLKLGIASIVVFLVGVFIFRKNQNRIMQKL